MPSKTREPDPAEAARFGPRAGGPMSEMFDRVSGRYELINTLLSLGQVRAWRREMAGAVPPGSRSVLDLCTGNGASLSGLRSPGRLVVGVDVSLGMLEQASEIQRDAGWAPRLVCADAFQLPFRDSSFDAVTIAFGMRNLRPTGEALAEIRRVLRPGGTLVVLEATAPPDAGLGPLQRLYLTRLVPWVGRLSQDPSAYEYLSRSILEFGSGAELEAGMRRASLDVLDRRSFLFGATRLWVARKRTEIDQIASNSPAAMQNASAPETGVGRGTRPLDAEWRAWTAAQAATSAALLGALAWGAWAFAISGSRLPLEPWQRSIAWLLLIGGILAFASRTVVLVLRWRRGRTPR